MKHLNHPRFSGWFCALSLGLTLLCPGTSAAEPPKVYKTQITPHWFQNDTRFWYRNNFRGDTKEFVLVDAERGTRAAAFDHDRLAASLSKAAGAEYKADRLPFDRIAFVDDAMAVAFKLDGATWKCDLASYELSKSDRDVTFPADGSGEVAPAGGRRRGRDGAGRGESRDGPDDSPDGNWSAFVKDQNVFVRSKPDGKETQLSQDGKGRSRLWTAHTENVNLTTVNWLEQTGEMIFASESNGWRHLYLIDTDAGKLKNPITRGEWIVRGLDRIDETNRQVWFRASGVYTDQDPYLMHYGRVNFDGSGLLFLTAANGSHSIQYSPDRRWIIDTYSRVDLAPVNELRRVSDGHLVCQLEEADLTGLRESGWKAPEVFVAKGRDGKTDIWGIICRPRDFDPNREYPVIEDIYAGPQSSYVPKTLSATRRYASLADLGFIVVKIDGMGTADRSKAFHDVCWHDLKDAGFPDRILWMKRAAEKHFCMDLTRVGVYGTSAGGQSAAGAVLFHPEFYKAAVANCGCHDNRMDKASWNEQWMGYPVGPHYGECSNVDNAHRLRGKLFLIVGELDNNVPPESTFRFCDALIKAGKDFDFLVVPNGGHGSGGSYAARRREDFFVRHLQGKEPPDRNAPVGTSK